MSWRTSAASRLTSLSGAYERNSRSAAADTAGASSSARATVRIGSIIGLSFSRRVSGGG